METSIPYSIQLKRAYRARRQIFAFAVFVVLASLDNAAAGVLPPLYAIVSRDLGASESALGFVTAVYLIIVALSAFFWGYRGDQTKRKPLLFFGTIVWGLGMIFTASAQSYASFLLFQMVTAVGVGSISSLGFSVISDVVPVMRRGLALSLWSISQGIGGSLGALLAGTLGAYNWRWPFLLIAGLGILFAILYLSTREPERGQAEPELAELYQSGQHYQYRIQRQDLIYIWQQPTTRWLLLQSFFFALAYGSTLWIPRWAIARVQAEGYSLESATIIGNLFVALFSLGAFASIGMGHLGDKFQRRSLRARPFLAMAGLLVSIPFFAMLYFIPLKGIAIPEEGNLWQMGTAVLLSLFTNGWIFLAFLMAFGALVFQATDPPNWAAMITDANLPEHRGTVIGISRMARALGSALSVALAGWLLAVLSTPEPNNYALTLAFFQILVLPAALCYFIVSRNIPQDIHKVRETLAVRGKLNR